MWLDKLIPEIDTCFSVQHAFDEFGEYISGSSVNIYLKDGSYLEIRVKFSDDDKSIAPNLNLTDCSNEIEELASKKQLEKIVHCTIDGFTHWTDNNPDPVIGGFLNSGRKAIVAVNKNGGGLIYVANNVHCFMQP